MESAEGFCSHMAQVQVESQSLVNAQVHSEARSQTWQIFACSRRATRVLPMSRSQKSLMPVARSLSNLARDFFRPLRPSHGVQEEHDGAEGLWHAAEGGRGETQGRSVTFGGSEVVGNSELEEIDHGGDASHQHYMVILSPPCTTFSQLRNLSNYKRAPQQVRAEEAEGLLHLEFAVQIANIQRRAGRGFLFEHPKSATSWHTPSLARLADQPDVFSVAVDMCRFGLKSLNGLPALKPTLLLTNVEPLATVLHRRCDGLHAQHGPLLGGQAHLAAKYTPDFVQAILQGIKQHVQNWTKGRRPQEDYWELLDNQVVRHHRVPRRGLSFLQEYRAAPFQFPIWLRNELHSRFFSILNTLRP